MRTMKILATLGVALGLAACANSADDSDETRDTMPTAMNEMSADGQMDDMHDAMPGAMGEHRMASSTGTVTAIDVEAGKITLDHGPIAEANWPAMTMEFDARPELLEGIGTGDTVAFDVAIGDGGGEVTAITKR